MSSTAAGVVFIVSLVIALALAYKPFGDYMFRAVTPVKHSRVERGLYRFIGVNPEGDQAWGVYARSVLAFSAVSVLVLYLLQRLQAPHSRDRPGRPELFRCDAGSIVEHRRQLRDEHELAGILR